jgi:hypothetical protein
MLAHSGKKNAELPINADILGNRDRLGALPRPDFPRAQSAPTEEAIMWVTFFAVAISIALGLALGAVMLESYEEKVRS